MIDTVMNQLLIILLALLAVAVPLIAVMFAVWG